MKYFLDFELPNELIATQISPERDGDRLLVFDKKEVKHEVFKHLKNYLKKGDVLVFNNSKVFKARLEIQSQSGVNSELLLLHQESADTWLAMVKKAKRFKLGQEFFLKNQQKAKVIEVIKDGTRKIQFAQNFSAQDANQIGQIPLPPYIIDERKKKGESLYTQNDEIRYQTVFAKYFGSVAAPTASLRFTEQLLQELDEMGIQREEITLHVGAGTFKPMDTDPNHFDIHHEYVSVPKDLMGRLELAKKEGRRIIAVGTTVCRALESSSHEGLEGWTNIFIKPPYQFRWIDGLITNFHLPQSTLLLLVQAFIGIDETAQIYHDAIKNKYRFFSYGDGMLLFPRR